MENVVQGQKSLRRGYTTGSCSAAATKAALLMMMSGERCETVRIDTPKGIELSLEVSDQEYSPCEALCSITKDAGDDPDATHGLRIFSRVSRSSGSGGGLAGRENTETLETAVLAEAGPLPYEEQLEISGVTVNVHITGGRGVGVVTRGGLSCDVGKSAINPVPRRMILKSVKDVLENIETELIPDFLHIEISAENGEETAKKTFNPKLGIVGGISILGTSGIVEPMSEKALVDTIRTEIKQFAELSGSGFPVPPMLVCPGNYGQDYARDVLGIDLESGVKCSNYIGEMLDYSCWLGIPKILLIGHAGKLIKIAAGVMNTHSSSADGRQEVIASHGAMLGMEPSAVRDIMNAISAEEMTDILRNQGEGFAQKVFDSIGNKIKEHIDHRTRGKLQVEFIVFTKIHGTLIKSAGADQMLKDLKMHQQENIL